MSIQVIEFNCSAPLRNDGDLLRVEFNIGEHLYFSCYQNGSSSCAALSIKDARILLANLDSWISKVSGDQSHMEVMENLLWHAEKLEEQIESDRGNARPADQLYAAGEMHNYMVAAKTLIESVEREE
jgi:hypothetical protein